MKNINLSILILISFFFVACAHHRDVRPGANGINRVVIPTNDKDSGTRDAISQANDYCESINKSAAFVDEKSSYTGDISEESYKNGKKISKAAKVLGGAGYAFGGRNERKAGGVVGLGGVVGDAVLGNGYTVEMRFKCQ